MHEGTRSGGLSRRDLLKVSAVGSAGLLVGTRAIAEIAPAPGSPAFVVDIPGLSDASANVMEIALGDLVIESRDEGSPAGVESLSGPGSARWDEVQFTFVMSDGRGNPGLREWYDLTGAGRPLRKDISIYLRAATGAPLGQYLLVGAYPVEWSTGTFDYRPAMQTETLVLKVNRIDERGV